MPDPVGMRRRREPVHHPNQYSTGSLAIRVSIPGCFPSINGPLTGPAHQIQWWCQFDPATARPIARAGFKHAPVNPGASPVLAHVTSPKLKPTRRGPRVRPYRTCCRGSKPVPIAKKLCGRKRSELVLRKGTNGAAYRRLTEDIVSVKNTWPGVICDGSKKFPPPI
jgi:hypothetical protein